MKALRIVFTSISILIAALYLAFLVFVPYCINLDEYAPQIKDLTRKYTGIDAQFKNLKVKTSWKLAIGASAEKADFKFADGEKFAQVNGLDVKFSLLPLLFKNFHIDSIEAEKVLANLPEEKLSLLNFQKPETKKSDKSFMSDKMPDINVKKYRISILKGQNNYTLKGEDLNVYDFVLDKKIKFKSKGSLILNQKKQINYSLSICSKVFPPKTKQETDFIKILDDMLKYNIKADLKAKLKIKGDIENLDISGFANLDKFSFKIGTKEFPPSVLNLTFKGNKALINSNLYLDKISHLKVEGIFKNGRKRAIDLNVSSDKIDIKDVLLVTKTMSKTFGLKGIEEVDANGLMKADFKIKSNFKKIQSSGYLKIKNGNLTNKKYKIALKSIDADVDFSQDAVKIKKANASLNGHPIVMQGLIDKNANADILIWAQNLSLKGILISSGNSKLLDENEIINGVLNLKATLKGRLNKAVPKIIINANNIQLKNKKTKTNIKVSKVTLNSDSKEKGTIELYGLKILPKAVTISASKLLLNLDKTNLNISPASLYINNIKTVLSGKISNIDKEPTIDAINISMPNQLSVPISGYPNSNLTAKGHITISGNLSKPKIEGDFNIPVVKIPTMSLDLRNAILKINKNSATLNCSQMRLADSTMKFNANLSNDFSNGIVVKYLTFNSDNIDLNTLLPLFKSTETNSAPNITILDGKSNIARFKVGRITSSNIVSDLRMKNNILYLDNLRADAYFGKIGGAISQNINQRKTDINLQGRGLSANPALVALTYRNDDINGQMDFDTDISFISGGKNEILNTLKGNTQFIISNGKMGALGKFEHLLYAQNVLSNNVLKGSLNLVAKAVTAKNTGVYRYMKGKISFSNGWANIHWVKTSGPSMSLYLTGRYYLPDNLASLTILGRISDDVVRILGPIGEFSFDKAISSIPKLGEITSLFASQLTTNPNYENISEIPYLTPKTELDTKEFKVIIDGNVQKQSSVKSFKWLSTPKVVRTTNPNKYIEPTKYTKDLPDFVKNLPDIEN